MFSSEKFNDSSDRGLTSKSECAYNRIPPPLFKKPLRFITFLSFLKILKPVIAKKELSMLGLSQLSVIQNTLWCEFLKVILKLSNLFEILLAFQKTIPIPFLGFWTMSIISSYYSL